jgi:DNA-binding response OmpR family regulator
MRILATEDDLDNVRLLENILRKKNTPLKLFQMVQRPCSVFVIKFDALLTDYWMMPEMDGVTLI